MKSRLPAARLAAIALLVFSAESVFPYVLEGSAWTSPAIVMQLQLGSSGGSLDDGSTSWNESAEGALAKWNSVIRRTEFRVVRGSGAPTGLGNGFNNVFFADSVYGIPWDPETIAVTLRTTVGARTDEADVIFNTEESWNSYSGPLGQAANGDMLLDLYRVALHEFGHVLGLDHPDDFGQSVTAIMNARVSDLDALAQDDINGAQKLYGAPSKRSKKLIAITEPRASFVLTSQKTFTFRGTSDASRVDGVYAYNLNRRKKFLTAARGLSKWSVRMRLRSGTNRIRIYYLPEDAESVKAFKTIVVRRQ